MKVKKIEILSTEVEFQKNKFNLFEEILKCINKLGIELDDGDIISISSKFAALSQGRIAKLNRIKPCSETIRIASEYRIPEQLTELIIRESDSVFGGVPGFLLTSKDGLFAPNAGIDRSNIKSGYAIMYPHKPYRLAEQIRIMILLKLGKKVGVILTDSRLLPGKRGTTGISIASSGFEALKDERGKKDLFGNFMVVTSISAADNLASSSQLLMGETNEKRPIVIIKNSGVKIIDKVNNPKKLTVEHNECLYLRELENKII